MTTKLPPVPATVKDPQTRLFLQQVYNTMGSIVTREDFARLRSGLVKDVIDQIPTDGVDYNIPPQITGLTATSLFEAVYLTWNSVFFGPGYHPGVGRIEIWKSTTNNIADATLSQSVTTDAAVEYADAGVGYWFWARAISTGGTPGPFSTPVYGEPVIDPALLLDALTGEITETQLYAALNSRINLIDAPGTGLVTQVNQLSSQVGDNLVVIEQTASAVDGLSGQYTVKIDNNGMVTGFGLSSETVNGVTNSYFGVNADRFFVANSGARKVITSLTRSGTVATATCASHGLAINDRIALSNVREAGWNGSYVVTAVPNSGTFQFTVASTLTSPATAVIRANGQTLTSLTRSGTTATAVFQANHKLVVGGRIDISGVTEAAWNAQYTVTEVVNATTVRFSVFNSPGAAVANMFCAPQTIPFVVADGKVVIDGAWMKQATITDAAIQNLGVNKVVGISSNFLLSTIGTGNITNGYIGQYIRSNSYVPGVSGWNIDKNGTAEFHNIYARGDILASSLAAGSVIVGSTIRSNYVPGVSGWSANADGTAEFNGVVITRPNVVASGTLTMTAPASWLNAHFRTLNQGGSNILLANHDVLITQPDGGGWVMEVQGAGGGYNGYWEFSVDVPTSQFNPDDVLQVNGRMLTAQAVVTNSSYWNFSPNPSGAAYDTACTCEVYRVSRFSMAGSFIRIVIRVPVPTNKLSQVYAAHITSIDWALSAFT